MDKNKELHLKRAKEGLDKIAEIRSRSLHPRDDEFERWQDRTWQSLCELFGQDHTYALSFRYLNFYEQRIVSDFSSGERWSSHDQQIWEGDLRKAEQLLKDAIEEFDVAPPIPIQPAAKPQSIINITNTNIQTTSVQFSQIIAALENLGLEPRLKSEAETEARALAAEASGQQRWPILAKSMEAMWAMGKPIYEHVALPLLHEMLKKKLGA